MQWGGAHVWKVGGKVYAIGGWDEEKPAYTFKVYPIEYDILRDMPGASARTISRFTRHEMDSALR